MSSGDIELGSATSEQVVSSDSSEMMVNLDKISKEELAELGVPTCCQGSGEIMAYVSVCCLVTVIVPLVLLFPLSTASPVFVKWVAVGLLVAGLLWVLFSLRVTLWDGVLALPTAPPLANSFVAADEVSNGGEEGAQKMKKVYVIVNPHGGLRKGMRALNQVVLPIWKDEFGIEATVLETEYGGHARVYARTVDLKGYDGICVIGGDGSVHEVCNGLLQRPPDPDLPCLPPVGILPGGSGNSLSLDLGTWSMAEAARRVGRGQSCAIDCAKVTIANNNSDGASSSSVVSVNVVAWGLVGNVGVVAEGFRWMGPSRYDAAALWGVAKGGGWPCKLQFTDAHGDKHTVDQTLMTAFVNMTQHFGKGLRPAPNARLDDGLMDLCCLEGTATRGEMLAIFQQLPLGSSVDGRTRGIHFHQVKSLRMDLGEAGVVNVDGEIMRHSGVLDFAVLPKALRVFCPPTYDVPSVAQAEKGKASGWVV
jgi:diacylglycerol kinase family enzyme